MTNIEFDEQYDVVVLGTGAAGSAAAIAAHDAGARVVLLEKTDQRNEGGNTRVSGASLFRNADVDGQKTYLQALSDKNPLPDDIVDVWSRETVANVEWLNAMGANLQQLPGFPPEYPELPGSDSYGGYLALDGQMGQQKLFTFLRAQLAERGIDIRYETPGRRLITDADGAVVGVIAEHDGREIRLGATGGVVLATGGFQANDELRREYLRLGGEGYLWGSPASTGDGLKMAMAVGADLWHMDNMMSISGVREPGSATGYYQAFMFHHGWMWVAPDGRRFADETAKNGHGVVLRNGYYDIDPVRFRHVIFDETTRAAGPVCLTQDMLPVGWNVLVEGKDWSADNQAEIDRGLIIKADTVAELAEKIGVPADALEETVTRFNASCDAGQDEQFGRPAERMAPLTQGPYYAISDWPMLAWTNGGPRRDSKSRVVDPFGDVIAGLYAAGEVSSTYSWGKDGGFHLSDAIAFGRLSGQDAARRAAAGA